MARMKLLDTSDKPTYVRLDKSTKEVLENLIITERRTRNGIVNLAVKEWLERHYPDLMVKAGY